MLLSRCCSLSAAIFFILSVFTATAQEPQKQEKKDQELSTIRVDTDLVSIDVNVTDRSGNHSAGGLRAEDFVIHEDGIRQKITNFSTADVPFNLVLLIDTSGSTSEQILLIRQAAKRFLDELRPNDRIALVQFSKDVEVITNLTSDRSKIEQGLNQFKRGSGTAFYDAVQMALDDVLKKVEGRKAIIALTDGVDSYGYTTYDQLIPMIEKAGTSLYFLEIETEAATEAGMMRDCKDDNHYEFSKKQLRKYVQEHLQGGNEMDYDQHCVLAPLERRQINRRLYESAHRELAEMAKQSGGHVYRIKVLQQLTPAYSQIAAELRTQYSLAYYPSNDKHDGKWRSLKVEIKRPGYQISAKPGYRAPLD